MADVTLGAPDAPMTNSQPGQPVQRTVSEQDKAMAKDWHKRITAAIKRHEKVYKQFELNRRLLAGYKGASGDDKVRANLHFANQAMLIPQIYAKDPEFSVTPTPRVGPDESEVTKKFAETAKAVIHRVLVKDAKLKKRMKAQLRSAYATAVGFLKASWQEDSKTDPVIVNRIKDTQDNIDRLQAMRAELDEPNARDVDLQLGQLREALEGLQSQTEVSVSKGMALDFVMSEDLLILDETIRTFSDYETASALAQRVWVTKQKFMSLFGYAPEKAKAYREKPGTSQFTTESGDQDTPMLYCVWEIWDQDSNRVYTLCDGDEGFCKAPQSPNWTGQRWYPFFGVGFNEIDGRFYPLSDVELTDPLVKEYNESRDDLVQDRRDSRPVNVVRKGGALTDDDVQRIRNRNGADIIMVEGVPGQPIAQDIFIGSLAKIDVNVYDTSPAQGDIERLIGGGDATTGSIREAKTATEAEILSQGLRGRSQERKDTIEDMLSELGSYTLECCLRRLSPQEVQRIAGAGAVWPQLSIEEIFDMVTVEVRGGSTGRPDRLQEQDRWTKLLPVIKEAMQQIADLRAQGQEELAQAVIALTKETLRRFDETLDIEEYLPAAPEEGQEDPMALRQQLMTMKQQGEELMAQLKALQDQQEKDILGTAADLATSANPGQAIPAFVAARQAIVTGEQPDMSAVPPPAPPEPGADGGQAPDELSAPAQALPMDAPPLPDPMQPPIEGGQIPPEQPQPPEMG